MTLIVKVVSVVVGQQSAFRRMHLGKLKELDEPVTGLNDAATVDFSERNDITAIVDRSTGKSDDHELRLRKFRVHRARGFDATADLNLWKVHATRFG